MAETHYPVSPKASMARHYFRATGQDLDNEGLDAAYCELLSIVHAEMEDFVRKYAPKRLVELDALMDQAFWQYH